MNKKIRTLIGAVVLTFVMGSPTFAASQTRFVKGADVCQSEFGLMMDESKLLKEERKAYEYMHDTCTRGNRRRCH